MVTLPASLAARMSAPKLRVACQMHTTETWKLFQQIRKVHKLSVLAMAARTAATSSMQGKPGLGASGGQAPCSPAVMSMSDNVYGIDLG